MSTKQSNLDPTPEDIKALLGDVPLLRDWLDLREERKIEERRAFIVEFAGMPKAGKSSAIENLRHFFSHAYRVQVSDEPTLVNSPLNEYQVYTPAEGVSLRTPAYLKSSKVDFNTWAGAYGIHELLQANHDRHNDLVILDRGPWDAGCWLQYWINKESANLLQGAELKQIADFFHLDHWVTRADLHVVLVVDPADAADREQTSRLIQHRGFASNTDGMQAMREIYEREFGELKMTKAKLCPNIGDDGALFLDSTRWALKAVSVKIIQAIFAVLRAKINHHAAKLLISEDLVAKTMENYLPQNEMQRRNSLKILPQYVKKAHSLDPIRRFRLSQMIRQHQAPIDLDLAARESKASRLKATLEELYRKAQSS